MDQQISQKENFLRNWDREFKTTVKVLKEYPESRVNFKPHERFRSAKELAWVFVKEEDAVISGIIVGTIDFLDNSSPPETMKEIISQLEESHKENFKKVESMQESSFNETVKFPIAPKTMGDLRKIDVLWTVIMDMIHHRGQFSVYLRMAGGKIPSIYGPSGDEPWN